MTMYDIPGLVSYATPLAVTLSNIMAGFSQAGIVPLDPEGFHARANYKSGFATDREDLALAAVAVATPDPGETVVPEYVESPELIGSEDKDVYLVEILRLPLEEALESAPTATGSYTLQASATPPAITPASGALQESRSTVTTPLEELRPFPKAGTRKPTKPNGRLRRTSAVLTDTPVKTIIEQEKAAVLKRTASKVFPSEAGPSKKRKESKTKTPLAKNTKMHEEIKQFY